MAIPIEVAQNMDRRLRELEGLLARAHGFIAVGPASSQARDQLLLDIAVALNWTLIDTKALLARFEQQTDTQT